MGSAYIPGLKVTDYTELSIERRLPLRGKVTVKKGQKVAWNTVVANTFLPGKVELINVSAKLGIAAEEVPSVMVKREGEEVEKDELIAQSKGFFGLFKSNLTSPIKGTIESVSEASGMAVLRAPSVPVEITAYVDGEIEEILADEGVVVKTRAAFIQGIFGIGMETAGEITLFCKNPAEVMDIAHLSEKYREKILVGGSLVTSDFLRQAVKVGVKAVIVGGIADSDLADFLGYDLGVAITGSEQVGLTLIVTEGFGQIAMAQRTFELLSRHENRWASVSGATQIRAGVIRPEIIIPKDSGEIQKEKSLSANQGLVIGTSVRLIREPHFGELAKVIDLPSEPQEIPTGAKVRVAVVELERGNKLTLPRANLEIIEN